MADLFSEVEPTEVELSLPEMIYGPVKLGPGHLQCSLRPSETVALKRDGVIALTARTKAEVLRHPDGEKLIIVARKRLKRPEGVDGVLYKNESGQLSWDSHTKLDEFAASVLTQDGFAESRALSWAGQFEFKRETSTSEGLRPPQIGALHAIGAHWSIFQHAATIVMPTGTGKTETMLSCLVAYITKPLLVVVPSDALRIQTAKKFQTFGLLRRLGALAENTENPIVGIISQVPKTIDDLKIFERCNVVVATMSSLADAGAEHLTSEIAKRVGVLIVDEAHHVGAKTWTRFKETFSEKYILQFTATPFRRDGKILDGQLIYSYPLKLAQEDGYFKPITFEPVYEPSKAAADEAIANCALEKLRADIAAGLNHLMMARCDTIERAQEVHAIYQRLAPELKPTVIHSKQSDAEARTAALIAGESRIAVCVNMLGEGFDLPQLKVAAVHDLHKSLAVLLQFTGRFTRSSGDKIGDATIVANIANANVSTALERLYSEDADWNDLLSEMSSDAAREHAKLTKFLNEAKRLDDNPSGDEVEVSHQLLRPTLSTLVYEASGFSPKNFHEGLPAHYFPFRVWLHEPSKTLFFVTRSEPTIKWTRSKSVKDREWALFVLHHDETRNLLYMSSSDHSSTFEGLAKAVGATKIVNGEAVFRSLGLMSRLVFQNIGVTKHGRRNLSYAMYTGADVATALGLTEKGGSAKNNLSGVGWELGKQTTIGCSLKGRIWSREQGPIPRLNDWCENVGDKLRDGSIDTTQILDNVLIPNEVSNLPTAEVMGIEWPVEILRYAEDKVEITGPSKASSVTTCDLMITGVDRAENSIDFALSEGVNDAWATYRFALGTARGFQVTRIGGEHLQIKIGKIEQAVEEYFSDYPPLFRFVDLTELDANLHIAPKSPQELKIDPAQFEVWDWEGVDKKMESMWKGGELRETSIQWRTAEFFKSAGFPIVIDDDDGGEAADLVCIKAEEDFIRVVLVHCKYSGGEDAGVRIKDVVEVSSQAIRSAKWNGRFSHLCQHLKNRNMPNRRAGRSDRFLLGTVDDLNALIKLSRFQPMKSDILIVQPGIQKSNRSDDQNAVLASASTYLKETIGVDLNIICSE